MQSPRFIGCVVFLACASSCKTTDAGQPEDDSTRPVVDVLLDVSQLDLDELVVPELTKCALYPPGPREPIPSTGTISISGTILIHPGGSPEIRAGSGR